MKAEDAATRRHGDATNPEPESPRRTFAASPRPPVPRLFRGPFTALRHRNYRLFWIGQLVSVTGTWVQSVGQQVLVGTLADPSGTHGQAAASWYLGLVSTVGTLPILFGCLFGGVVADRVDKRRLIMMTQMVMMLCAFVLAALAFTNVVQIWHVMVLAACLGTATAFDLPARQAFVVEMVGRDDIGGAVALNSSLFNAARIMGPSITGFLLAAHVSVAMCFFINGVSFLAVIAGLLRMRMPSVERARVDGKVLEHIREGLAYARRAPLVRRILTLVFAFGTFAFSYNVLLFAFARYYLVPGLPAEQQARDFGMMESIRGVGALCAALTTATLAKRNAQKKLVVFGVIGSTIGLLLFSTMHSLWPACFVIAFTSFSFVCCFASCNTLVQLQVPDVLRGRVMGLYVLLNSGMTPFGSLTAGALARSFGTPFAIRSGVFIALILFGGAMLLDFSPRRHGGHGEDAILP